MKRILVPTDFSKAADNALQYAIALAKREKAKIILLNTWEVLYPSIEMPESAIIVAEQIAAAEYNSLKHLSERKAIAAEEDIKVESYSRQGTLVNTILDISKERNVDLIVMGTEGASGLKRFFMGSNTAKVIEKAHCPVIAVPEKARFHGLKKIVYATDFLNTDIKALKKVAELAALFKSEILLLHVDEATFSSQGSIALLDVFTEKIIEETGYDRISSKVLYSTDVESELEDYADKKGTDLFVMSTMQHTMFDRLFGKSLTKRMSYHSKIPLMAFHHTEHAIVFI